MPTGTDRTYEKRSTAATVAAPTITQRVQPNTRRPAASGVLMARRRGPMVLVATSKKEIHAPSLQMVRASRFDECAGPLPWADDMAFGGGDGKSVHVRHAPAPDPRLGPPARTPGQPAREPGAARAPLRAGQKTPGGREGGGSSRTDAWGVIAGTVTPLRVGRRPAPTAARTWRVAPTDVDACPACPVCAMCCSNSPLSRCRAGEEADDVVGEGGFEPPTWCTQSTCAARLRYSPVRA